MATALQNINCPFHKGGCCSANATENKWEASIYYKPLLLFALCTNVSLENLTKRQNIQMALNLKLKFMEYHINLQQALPTKIKLILLYFTYIHYNFYMNLFSSLRALYIY